MTEPDLRFIDAYMAFCKDRAPDYNEVGLAYFRAAWEASRKQMAEEAAAVCMRMSSELDVVSDWDASAVATGCARVIRSLATPTEGKK